MPAGVPSEVRRPLRKLTLSVPQRSDLTTGEEAMKQGLAIARGMAYAKDLGNLPGNVCTPEYLGEQALALAKELKAPVLALSQLNRSLEQRPNKRPIMSDLRESGAIEQDADVVLFINRPNFYKTDLPEEDRAKAEVIIAKQRNGPTGNLNFVFLARHTRFEEAAPDAWSVGGEPEE